MPVANATNEIQYLTGFGGNFETEAVSGALPKGRNSPQRPAFGLYAEQLSGSAFTAPRHENRRSWLYRMRPTADHRPFEPIQRRPAVRAGAGGRAGGAQPPALGPARRPSGRQRFRRRAGDDVGQSRSGRAQRRRGALYRATPIDDRSRVRQCRWRAADHPAVGHATDLHRDGPAGSGAGLDRADPARCEDSGSRSTAKRAAMSPKTRVPCSVCRNLARSDPTASPMPRDFETPVAAYEDVDGPCEVVQKYQGALWSTTLDHSPLDVVAWHGNLAPCRYELARFNAIGYGQLRPSRSVDFHRPH